MTRSRAFDDIQDATANHVVALALGLRSEQRSNARTPRRYVGLQADPGAANKWLRVVGICDFPGCAARGGHRLDFTKLSKAGLHCYKCGSDLAPAGDVAGLPKCVPELDQAGDVIGWRCKSKLACAGRAAEGTPVKRRGTVLRERAAARAASRPPPSLSLSPPRGTATPSPGGTTLERVSLERVSPHVEEGGDSGGMPPLWPFAARLGGGPPVAAPPEEWFVPAPQ